MSYLGTSRPLDQTQTILHDLIEELFDSGWVDCDAIDTEESEDLKAVLLRHLKRYDDHRHDVRVHDLKESFAALRDMQREGHAAPKQVIVQMERAIGRMLRG